MIRNAQTRFTRRRRESVLRARAGIAALAGLLVAGSIAVDRALTVDTVQIDELRLPTPHLARWANQHRNRWLDEEITLFVDGHPHRRTRAALGGRLSVDRLIAAVERATKHGPSHGPAPIYWSAEIDHERLLATIFELRARPRSLEPEETGADEPRTLDLHGALRAVRQTLPTSSVLVELPTRRVVLGGHTVATRPGTFSQELAAHSSSYRKVGRSWSRGYNIEQAARALDGVVIEPHGDLSFNEVVGDRSFRRGFMPAQEVARGRVVDGIGGGVCQVATALHGAALVAGFEILEHYVHSKRPRYAARGVDTAVAWGFKDLRIRNPYDDYVRIRGDAFGGTLTVGLWSGGQAPRVEIATSIREGRLDVRHEPLLLERTRTVYWPDGPRTDRAVLRYPAEPRD